MYHKPPAVIIDAGTAGLKYGLDIDEEPRVIPSVVARARDLVNLPMTSKSFFVGREAQNAMDCFVTTPIRKRKVVDWDGMEKLWSYTFQDALQLREYRDRNVILAEPTLTHASHRNKTLEYMFEKYKFGGVYIGDASALALRFAGNSKGLVIDSGEEVTQVVPIQYGQVDEQKVQSLELGGKDVTEYLALLLTPQLRCRKNFNYDNVREIKESMCMIALDYEDEVKDNVKLFANFPIGPKPTDQIKFDIERIKCTELMFHPSLDRQRKESGSGFAELVFEALQKYNRHVQKQFYQNIVLVGGNTMFQGLQARLKKDLLNMQKAMKIPEIVPRFATAEVIKYNYPTWKGALLVTKSQEMEESLITKADYKERGTANLSKVYNQKLNNRNWT